MNKGLNIFLVVFLCVISYVGLLLSFYSSDDSETWNPKMGYAMPTGRTYGTSAVSVDESSTGSDVAAISVRSANSMFHHRPSFSYAPASAPAYSQSPIGGTSSNSVASPIYATSSAEFHSFGGGGNTGGVSISGGVVKSSGSAAPAPSAGLSVSMPSTSLFTFISPSTNIPIASGDPVMASVAASSYTSSYSSIGYATGGSTSRGISGRKNGAAEDSWLQWLARYGSGFGTESGDEENGYTYSFDYYQLQNAYNEYVNNYWDKMWGDPPSFDQWLLWFKSNDGSHGYRGDTYNWVPVGDYYLLLVLALLYVGYIAIRRRKSQISKNNI